AGLMGHSFFSLLFSIGFLTAAAALSCYDENKGITLLRSDPSFKYCSIEPGKEENGKGRLAGMSIETDDNLSGYDALFGQSNPTYSIRSICVLDKHTFPWMDRAHSSENQFRCVCATDGSVTASLPTTLIMGITGATRTTLSPDSSSTTAIEPPSFSLSLHSHLTLIEHPPTSF
ncbi:hypothetical protein PMAYCL1PPCAC_28707, partial [Pristionchus mayeri]